MSENLHWNSEVLISKVGAHVVYLVTLGAVSRPDSISSAQHESQATDSTETCWQVPVELSLPHLRTR